MRQLMFDAPGTVRWEDAADPVIADPAAAIVRPIAVATCDIDVGALRGIYPMTGPYPLGHEGVAEVVDVGDAVVDVRIGDRVVVPFQISCGSCGACRRGRTGNCEAHPRLSTFGLGALGGLQWGGLLADLALVPHADAMLVAVPDHIEATTIASASDNIPDAWRCVGPQLAAEPGAEVLVVGGDSGPNSIGLYAAGLALAAGADRGSSTSIAMRPASTSPDHSVPKQSRPANSTQGRRLRDHRGRQRHRVGPALCAGEHCLRRLVHESLGLPPGPEPPDVLDVLAMLHVAHRPRARAPRHSAVLAAVDAGFDPRKVTSTVVDWDDAESTLAEPPMKLVISRSSSAST